MRLFGFDLKRARSASSSASSADGRRSALARKLFKIMGGGQVRAKYDAAQTTDENRRHWINADSLSADAAASPSVRDTLRRRARYEVANSSYARGIVLTLANDVVGTGPRLQLLTPDTDTNIRVERAFAEWSKAIGLPEKLRTMRMCRAQDGEAFALLANNPGVTNRVKLDVRLIEADQVTTPVLTNTSPNQVDGIVFDKNGNPKTYQVLRNHPGSDAAVVGSGMEFDSIDAENMIHLFRADRPGQSRGIPDITPALPLFAMLRRYTLAVLGAAETAASFAGVLQTDGPPDEEVDPVETFDAIELEMRNLLTMPQGWKMGQIKAEQPTTTYVEFTNAVIGEIARCLNMPFNIAAGNSKDYNYASGRLDHQTYFKAIRVDQSQINCVVMDRILSAWLSEAVLLSDFLPQRVRSKDVPPHQWFWDGQVHVDPSKEATAQEKRLANNTTTLAQEYAMQGRDWESELRQRAKELSLMVELGLVQIVKDGGTQ